MTARVGLGFVSFVGTSAVVGLISAMTGRLLTVLTLTLAIGVTVVVVRSVGDSAASDEPIWAVAALTAVVALSVAGNVAFHSELVFTGRDGATYANEAKALATGGSLRPVAIPPPFDPAGPFDAQVPGFVPADDGRVDQQFLHMFPVLLGLAGQIGGDAWMYSLNAVLGGLGLLMVYLFGRRFLTVGPALLAIVALAVSYPFLYFARSTFTEIVMLTAVFGGLWLGSVGYASESRTTVSIAGMLLGLAALARVDGWMVGVALAWAPTVLVLVGRGIDDRRWVLERLWVGFLVIASLGLVDLALFSPVYLGNVRNELLLLIVAAVLGRAISQYVRGNAPRLAPFGASIAGWIARIGPAVIVIVASGLFLIRPLIHSTGPTYGLEGIEQLEGLPIGTGRDYAELTLRSIGWYLGIPTLVLALTALAFWVRRGVTSWTPDRILAALVLAVPTVVYVASPHANPDQPWVMRRYLPVVIPALILAAVTAVSALTRQVKTGLGGFSAGRSLVAALLAAAVVIPPAVTTAPLVTAIEHERSLADISAICAEVQGRPVALVEPSESQALSDFFLYPIRNWCDVPVVAVDGSSTIAKLPDGVVLVRAGGAEGQDDKEVTMRTSVIQDRLLSPPNSTRIIENTLSFTSTQPD